ncbi:UDP-3-O-acyl-N-acetylglucosamine deacetylase [Roseovarius aestuariivivens]|uniref:UDP-3-O-acyl-N-acetylglucosamine deacetylase n=1 Tax=Roseovarius aestuariivivens TaxID=1888910 RepID=UPI00107FFE50|nr:UDP-3-O-acyl-N-acetylglucosamine deacetylase [Roseovarius aestuariivivens]
MQTTIKTPASFEGVGLHSGASARLTILPAPANRGIVFRRLDCSHTRCEIPARWDVVKQSPLCTLLENDAGVAVSTVEHVMAALAGCGIHNAVIEVDGPEVPILDGSAAPFVRGILRHGVRRQHAPLDALRVLKPVEVRRGDATARLVPHDTLLIEFAIEFEDSAIGAQKKLLNMSNGSFVRELSDARTFCRQADVDAMRANGLALGGTPGENAVVFDGDRVLSPGGLRHADEPVRHKMLDALGDLALAGLPILGHYQGDRAGHALTNDLLRSLFADREAFEVVRCTPRMAARLPGAGVHWGEIPAVA